MPGIPCLPQTPAASQPPPAMPLAQKGAGSPAPTHLDAQDVLLGHPIVQCLAAKEQMQHVRKRVVSLSVRIAPKGTGGGPAPHSGPGSQTPGWAAELSPPCLEHQRSDHVVQARADAAAAHNWAARGGQDGCVVSAKASCEPGESLRAGAHIHGQPQQDPQQGPQNANAQRRPPTRNARVLRLEVDGCPWPRAQRKARRRLEVCILQ